LEKWSAAEFVQYVVEKGGFEKDKITLTKADVYCTTPELTHFATMLWSFIGGTSEAGWLKSDEENWKAGACSYCRHAKVKASLDNIKL
jgi:hypothetical protein